MAGSEAIMSNERTPEEVGRIIQARIDEKELSLAEIERRGGPSGRTVRAYAKGAPVKDIDNRRTLSLALEWSPDSIRLIQQGEDPKEQARVESPADDIQAMADRAVTIIQELARRAAR